MSTRWNLRAAYGHLLRLDRGVSIVSGKGTLPLLSASKS